jgi:hypothetical protein
LRESADVSASPSPGALAAAGGAGHVAYSARVLRRPFAIALVTVVTGCGSANGGCPHGASTNARPAGRANFSALLAPDTIFVHDGDTAPGKPTQDLWRYAFGAACAAWQALAPSTASPSARAGYAAARDSTRDRFLYTGGVEADGNALLDTWSLDPNKLAFTKLATVGNLPLPRPGRAAAYDPMADRLLLLGDIAYELDFAGSDQGSWQAVLASGTPPPARSDFASTVDPTRSLVVLFGGARDVGGLSNEVFAYDFLVNRWQAVATTGDVPTPRSGARMQWDAQDKLLLVFGGSDASGVQNDLYTLSLDGNGLNGKFARVSRPGAAPPARTDFGMTVSGDSLWIFGGSGKCGQLDDVWILLLDGGGWSNVLPQSSC